MTTFLWLCEKLENQLRPEDNNLKAREPLSLQKQVGITLCFLASCSEYRIVGHLFGVHKSTVHKCVYRVVNSIIEELMETWISMPDATECEYIAFNFEKKCNIPQLIGAIDGTHIPILPPSDGYRDYINRKG